MSSTTVLQPFWPCLCNILVAFVQLLTTHFNEAVCEWTGRCTARSHNAAFPDSYRQISQNEAFSLVKCIRLCVESASDHLGFDVNLTTFDDVSRKRFSHFRSQWPWPLTFITHICASNYSTKLEVSTAFPFRENRWHIILSNCLIKSNLNFPVNRNSVFYTKELTYSCIG